MALKHFAMFAAALLVQAGTAQSGSSLQRQLEARYTALEAAMESKDEPAIRSVLADGLVAVDVDGKPQDVGQMLKMFLAFPNDPNRRLQTTILSVRGDERTAIVKHRSDMTTKLRDTDGSEKSATTSAVSTDTWLRQNGSWRLARTVMNDFVATVNGKTVHKTNSITN
jgi:ketosteroid isomerase-like protein